MPADELLLPSGSVLLHIGPFKTGSTAIQQALAARRPELLEHGVLYPGQGHRQRRATWGVLGRTPPGVRPATIASWERLLQQIAATEATRICLSSEDLGTAGPRIARRVLADLGPERVHVVSVVRRLDRLLPSQWQERIKTCFEVEDYGTWLRHVLAEERASDSARRFWWSHDVAAVLPRWMPPLSPDQISLVVTDDSDHDLLPRTFEAMLGLPAGFLTPPRGENSSLSLEKVELYRQVNEIAEREQWPPGIYRQLVRLGVLQELRAVPRGPHDVAIPPLPPWARERVAELSDRRADAVAASGVRLIGDPDLLRIAADGDAEALPERPTVVSVETAVAAVVGAVHGALEREAARQPAAPDPTAVLDGVGTRELARTVLGRVRARALRRR